MYGELSEPNCETSCREHSPQKAARICLGQIAPRAGRIRPRRIARAQAIPAMKNCEHSGLEKRESMIYKAADAGERQMTTIKEQDK